MESRAGGPELGGVSGRTRGSGPTLDGPVRQRSRYSTRKVSGRETTITTILCASNSGVAKFLDRRRLSAGPDVRSRDARGSRGPVR